MEPTAKRLDWHTLIKTEPETSAKVVSALDKYFEPFAQPPGEVDEYDGKFRVAKGQPCLKCDRPLMNGLLGFLTNEGFTWGLAHGEGHCSVCRWPARMYHFIKDAEGNDVATIRGVCLQYHPDFVEERKKTKVA